MPKLTKQSKAQKRIVRQMQRWLAQHEYKAAFKFKLHACELFDEYNRSIAICRTGVVVCAGGGCYIDHWSGYKAQTLKRLFNAAKRVQQKREKEAA
jgi:hypothetical protein|tara:strand:- start:284 stop:571 length:288 start_codon:yes stop_codon:yes gene_type:complete